MNHLKPQYKKYIQEVQMDICGQGIYHSYEIMLFGNGHNKYTFTLEREEEKGASVEATVQYIVTVEDRHLIQWVIKNMLNEENPGPPNDCIYFEAVGRIEKTRQYVRLESKNCMDFDHLNKNLKVIDITIQNEHPEVSFQWTKVTNEYAYCDYRDKIYQNIDELLNRQSLQDIDINFTN
jgi:hypothetical protein